MACIVTALEEEGILVYCMEPIFGFNNTKRIQKLKQDALKATMKNRRKYTRKKKGESL